MAAEIEGRFDQRTRSAYVLRSFQQVWPRDLPKLLDSQTTGRAQLQLALSAFLLRLSCM
jgi:hypothetical protein